MINTNAAAPAPSRLFTFSSNTNIPQKNEMITLSEDHVPTLIARPAFRIP
jgi:hypothetical protein